MGAIGATDREGLLPTWSDENIKVWALPIEPTPLLPSVTARGVKKRSFDEAEGQTQSLRPAKSPATLDLDRQMRMAVVSEMFDSSWRLDTLMQMPISQVQLPAVLFIRDEAGRIGKYTGPMPSTSFSASNEDGPFPDVTVLVRKPWPGAMIQTLPSTRPSPTALSYIVKNHPQRGKFMPAKAKALGVTPGPLFAELTRGNSVTTLAGTTVTPDMVLAEGKEGGGFAVGDLPTVDYVQGLIDRKEWRTRMVMHGVGAVVWILGPGVGRDERLRLFVRGLPGLEHIVSSPDYCPNYLALDSSASASISLHQVDRTKFPVPVHDNVTLPQTLAHDNDVPGDEASAFQPAQRGMTVQLEPSVEVQLDKVQPPLNTAKVWQEVPRAVLHLAREAKEAMSAADPQDDLPSKDAEIIFLGTGSAQPSKYRNVSATLLRVPGFGSYLFDCGEDTLGQLRRVFAPPELAEVLRDLKAIWISHLHADHHLGTVSVIREWHREVWENPSSSDVRAKLESGNRLAVISDEAMIHWLAEYAWMEDFGHDRLIPLSIKCPNHGGKRSTVLIYAGDPTGSDMSIKER